MMTGWEFEEMTASPQAEIARLRRALELANLRVEILLGRMRACNEERPESHSVSMHEGPAWVEEGREALAASAVLWRAP